MMGGEKGSASKIVGVQPFCNDCYILQTKTYLEYANGTEASSETGVYNHHAVYMNLHGRSQVMACQGGGRVLRGPKILGGSAIDGSHQVYTTADGKFKSGNYVPQNAKVKIMYELVNYKTEPQDIYLVSEIEAVQGPREDYLDAAKLALSATTCAKAQWVLKNSLDVRKSHAYTVPHDAYVINIGGHMHDGGDMVSLELNDKAICTAKAIYEAKSVTTGSAHNGHMGDSMSGMSSCGGVREIKKGDKLTVTSTFNATAHPM